METKDWIELLTQAPLAVILIYFIYKSMANQERASENQRQFMKEVLKILKKRK